MLFDLHERDDAPSFHTASDSFAAGLHAGMVSWPGRIKCIFLCISLLWGGVLSFSVSNIAGTSALNDDTGKLRMLSQKILWQVATHNRTDELQHTRAEIRQQLHTLDRETVFVTELEGYFDVLHHPDEWSFQHLEAAASSVVLAVDKRNSERTRHSWALFASAISLCVVVTVSQTALLMLLVSSTKKEQLRNIKGQISQHRKAKPATNITRNHGGRTPPLLESSRSRQTLGHNLSSHTTLPPPPTGPLLLELATGVRPSAEAEMRKTRVNPVESA